MQKNLKKEEKNASVKSLNVSTNGKHSCNFQSNLTLFFGKSLSSTFCVAILLCDTV